MNLNISVLNNILKTDIDIIDTATNVNELSRTRKQITSESLLLLTELIEKNNAIIINYKQVFSGLQAYISKIAANVNLFSSSIMLFEDITSKIGSIKTRQINISDNIIELIKIVNLIKSYTDEINVLAKNASIVSSKYNKISGVFEILSLKLNDMSNYITQNLEKIISYVSPIKENMDKLKDINSSVQIEIQKGHQIALPFSLIISFCHIFVGKVGVEPTRPCDQ